MSAVFVGEAIIQLLRHTEVKGIFVILEPRIEMEMMHVCLIWIMYSSRPRLVCWPQWDWPQVWVCELPVWGQLCWECKRDSGHAAAPPTEARSVVGGLGRRRPDINLCKYFPTASPSGNPCYWALVNSGRNVSDFQKYKFNWLIISFRSMLYRKDQQRWHKPHQVWGNVLWVCVVSTVQETTCPFILPEPSCQI